MPYVKKAVLKRIQRFSNRLLFLAFWKLFQEQFLRIFLQEWSVSVKASREIACGSSRTEGWSQDLGLIHI